MSNKIYYRVIEETETEAIQYLIKAGDLEEVLIICGNKEIKPVMIEPTDIFEVIK